MQSSPNLADNPTIGQGQGITLDEYKALMNSLTDPATGRLSPALIAVLSSQQKDQVVQYHIDRRRTIIADFVTDTTKAALMAADYLNGYHNDYFSYWIRPEHAKTYRRNQSEPDGRSSSGNYSFVSEFDQHLTGILADNKRPLDESQISNPVDTEGSTHHVNEVASEVDEQPKVIVLTPDIEEAYGIWLFRCNQKTNAWHFSSIYQNGIFQYLNQQGYYKRYSPDGNSLFFLRDQDNLISEVIPARMRDSIRAHVDANLKPAETEKYSVTYAARSEKLRRTSNSLFNDKTLQELPTHDRPILQDSSETCYLPFLNGIVEVSKNSVKLSPYSTLQGACFWKSQVISRNYNPNASSKCHFAHFIDNVTKRESDRKRAFRTAIGYAIHSYNSPSESQAIICCDEELTDKAKPQGGTGKGLWVNAIKQMRPLAFIDGKKFDPDNQFCFQAVDRDTRVVWLDDVKTNFSFDRFFSVLTAGWTIEKKNQSAYTIPQREGPKLIICTNTAPSVEGSSNARRQFILEFSDYYKILIKPGQKSQPIRETHGCEFFTDEWDVQEWERFDHYMIECVFEYMSNGLIPYQTRNVNTNRLVQTTSDEFYAWVTTYSETGLQANQEYKRPDLLAHYREYAGLSEKELSSRRFTEYIKRFAGSKGWTFKLGSSNKSPSFTLKSDP